MVLVSPGVQVTVTDESFFSSAGPGTVPLIFLATKQDKLTPDGTATAPGSTTATAEQLYLISSQRELLQTFGDPDFNEIGGASQHGYPLNEFGLLAAYSYLGAASRAYVIRADLDTAELDPASIAPTSAPADATYWNNTNNFVPGLFKWVSAGVWNAIDVTVVETTALIADGAAEPSSGYSNGTFICNFDAVGNLQYMQRNAGTWLIVGDTAWLGVGANDDFQWAPHNFVPTLQSDNAAGLTTGSYWLKSSTPNSGLSVDVSHYDSSLAQFVSDGTIPMANNHASYYGNTTTPASDGVTAGTVVGFVDSSDSFAGSDELPHTPQAGALANVSLEIHNGATTVVVSGTAPVTAIGATASSTFDLNGTTTGDLASIASIDALVIALNGDVALTGESIVASKSSTDVLILTALDGRDIVIANIANDATDTGLTAGTTSNFSAITLYEADTTQPVGTVADGTYWYDPSFTVDILQNGLNGLSRNIWDDYAGTLTIATAAPTSPSFGDLWLDTDASGSYPVIYRWTDLTVDAWVLIDNTDQTSALGIVFADARPAPVAAASGTGINNGGNGTDPDLDFDAPDPLLYPVGTLLFNTRYSGRNVKQWTLNATFSDAAGVVPADRWVSASGNAEDGSLIAGADAQRKVVTDAIASVIVSNEEVRDDTIFYNLIATPGFPELIDEMLTLNLDRKEQAFVLGDSPFDLSDSTTSLQAWSSNSGNAAGNGSDGLVSADANLGVYYPSGLSTNVDGSEVVVPASHMILRTMAFNDQVSYPWFAPAGFTRGTVNNATSVGYLNSSDEFVASSLNQGQRDTLQLNNVNPIASIPNRGLVVYGQKTRLGTASALDRVNVARLINHIRYQADLLGQPFLFEPNDRVTRDAVKESFDSFLSELITLRGLTDFLVVVDESNNTPARIDRNELWIDIAVQPVKSIEFIYIPIRIQNTGADLNL